ncbi:hypothetical protein [Bradyrhizobium pachyrhizi]|uniref:hypothetical protein n=1 Tax=Bradyrhizobium pachyrhizi TaxID=280333 RepID=UPI00067C806A|nr:hypothetical protein [Bradyrhizobium pachyrhizi]
MAQAKPNSTTSRRRLLQALAGGGALVAGATTTAALAAEPDPIFAALVEHAKVDDILAGAAEAVEAAERELDRVGDLNPCVISVGNSEEGFPSMTHVEIDRYTPADEYPDRNRDEHVRLSASWARRVARLDPLNEALAAAEAMEMKAREKVDNIEPITLAGALAALKFTRRFTL